MADQLAFAFLDEVPVVAETEPSPKGEAPEAVKKPQAPKSVPALNILEVYEEALPMFAPGDLAEPLHFFDIYTCGAFCGAETQNYASWFWCATCKRTAEECPATFCPKCRAAFEQRLAGRDE